ncbi:uncharacterized protein LOC132698172 [Cylas formicarius]|uniref:uncharacterized protein LOC132698172 n=1 Tax=Cylas formicarius TaxID=197179 RepID=UPI0029587969|nr:uncharacterized protein LOC132698172 [Cylas formicarius]
MTSVFGFALMCVLLAQILADDGQSIDEETSTETAKNNTGQDLYIIRKVVYEIGILTEADGTDYDNKTHEQIDVSFFDPNDNGTAIDLSNVPVPIETNVSGIAVTGILSSNLGTLIFPPKGAVNLSESNFPVFPDKQVKVTRNITTVDKEKSLNILSGISEVLGLDKLIEPQKPIGEVGKSS